MVCLAQIKCSTRENCFINSSIDLQHLESTWTVRAAKSIASTYQRQGTLPASYIHTIEWHQQLHQLPGSLLLLKLSVKLVNHLSHHEAAHSLQNYPDFSENTHPGTSLYFRNNFQAMMCIATTRCALDTVTGVLNDITNIQGVVSKGLWSCTTLWSMHRRMTWVLRRCWCHTLIYNPHRFPQRLREGNTEFLQVSQWEGWNPYFVL